MLPQLVRVYLGTTSIEKWFHALQNPPILLSDTVYRHNQDASYDRQRLVSKILISKLKRKTQIIFVRISRICYYHYSHYIHTDYCVFFFVVINYGKVFSVVVSSRLHCVLVDSSNLQIISNLALGPSGL